MGANGLTEKILALDEEYQLRFERYIWSIKERIQSETSTHRHAKTTKCMRDGIGGNAAFDDAALHGCMHVYVE